MPWVSEVTIVNGPLPTMLDLVVRNVRDGTEYDIDRSTQRATFLEAFNNCLAKVEPPADPLWFAGCIRNAYILGKIDQERKHKENVWWRRIQRHVNLLRKRLRFPGPGSRMVSKP